MAVNLTAGSYGNNSLPPVLAGLRCTGREGSFSNCTPINGNLLQSCSAVAAVACEPVIGKGGRKREWERGRGRERILRYVHVYLFMNFSITIFVRWLPIAFFSISLLLPFPLVELNTTINGTISLGPDTNTSLTCNVGLEYFYGNFSINSLGWYRNGQLLTNVSGRYNITRMEIVQQRCDYDRFFNYICDNYTVTVRLVLAFENLMTSDGGDYVCAVNITNLNYSRTVVNTTTETLLIPGKKEGYIYVCIYIWYLCTCI